MKSVKLLLAACAVWVVIGFAVLKLGKPNRPDPAADARRAAEDLAVKCEWVRVKLDDVRELTLRGRKYEAEQELASVKRTAPECFK